MRDRRPVRTTLAGHLVTVRSLVTIRHFLEANFSFYRLQAGDYVETKRMVIVR
jgi:hypothetical protein